MASNKVLVQQWLFMLFIMLVHVVATYGARDNAIQASLLKFRSSLSNAAALSNWKPSISLCNGNKSVWAGVLCRNGDFYGLRLENMSLSGMIDTDALAEIPILRSLSFMNNSFKGPMPAVNKLNSTRVLYLSLNGFSGDIPDDAFHGMKSLWKVYLERNEFTGKIPESLVTLPSLWELSLVGNQFEGNIPDFQQSQWRKFNLSYNNFAGPIPGKLSNLVNSSSFLGDIGLCGKPLDPCKPPTPTPKPKRHYLLIIGILVIVTAALALFGAILYVHGRRAKTSQYEMARDHEEKAHKNFGYDVSLKESQSAESPAGYRKGEHGKLFFVRNDRERFDLQDLLRAPAEELGSGSFGSSYKAVLLSGPTMVVKRFKQMNNGGKDEFHDHMRKLGRLSHPNLLPLMASYYTKEEKLLITDFVENGSLASHLHGRRAPGQSGLDWPTRLKIIKGVARGLACIHKEFPTLSLPHGHLKSSNVLLDHNFRPILSDFFLVPLINKDHAHQYMAAYKSPEFTQTDRTSKKTDVWCLGILILELLTGKFPANYLKHGKGANVDLATWVNSVVREEWTGEVFDMDMKGTKDSEEEMLKLLKIGMCCCEWNVERRWDLKEAVEKIEELSERDVNEEGSYSSNGSEGDMYSSRALTEEDFSFLG
ncbi:putative LRR receptor-like serine/threonine-protein kinase At4g31250 [Castanea sativa]|uniref:putative LRR receptor-like serine/threonine-protein kinase At4g31250 n=1 Tax=Castanea sativa TaxID=21020 RepID=UPI003F65308C